MTDFFISYTNEDLPWAEWIGWQLEQAGYTTVLQAWDFRPGENFLVQMRDALDTSDRTIAVLSPAYLQSAYCTDEWTAAFIHDETGADRLVPVRIKACELPRLLATRIYVDLVDQSPASAKSTLLDGVRARGARPTKEPTFPGESQDQPDEPRFPGGEIWNVPIPENPFFTDRDELLQRLNNDMRTSRANSVCCHVITGLAGIGKTQLVAEYAYRHRADYDLVWWLRAEDPMTLRGDYAALALEVGLAESADQDAAVAGMRAWLEHQDRWLLVFDNVEDLAELASTLPRQGDGHALITSRRDVGWDRIATRIPLDVLDASEAVEFLLARTGQSDKRIDESDTATAGELAEALGRLPLALEQAGGLISEAGILTFAQYLTMFEERSIELLKHSPALAEYDHTIDTTWTVAVNQLRQQAPSTVELMQLAAFLAPEELPSQVLTDNSEVLPETLAAQARDPLKLVKVVAAARNYSLIKASGGNITLHRLLQTVIREGLNSDDQHAWAGVAVRLVLAAFPEHGEDVSVWPVCRQLLPHALTAAAHGEQFGVEPRNTAFLLDRVARYATGRAEYMEAQEYLERSLRIGTSVLGPDSSDVAIIQSDLGVVLAELGEFDAARAQLEGALPKLEESFGPTHPELAIHLSSLAHILMSREDYDGARPLIERALDIAVREYGPEHSTVAIYRGGFGEVLKGQGDNEGAMTQFEQAIDITEKFSGRDHPDIARYRDGLGRMLLRVGDYDGAKFQSEQALDVTERAYGPNHPRVAGYRSNLGQVFLESGNLFAARAEFEKALTIAKSSLGPNHPTVKKIRENVRNVFPGSQSRGTRRRPSAPRPRRKRK